MYRNAMEEELIVARDLNGHVGINRKGYER